MDAIFEAVLQGENETSRILKQSSASASLRMTSDFLVESIPHWLYKSDTPLHLAAAASLPKIAKLLLESGAEVNAQNRRGATPLLYACDPRPQIHESSNSQNQATMIRLLIHHGANLNHQDQNGASAMHRAVRARSPAAVSELLKAGASPDIRSKKNGSTPLHLAVQSTGAGGTAGAAAEQTEIINLLLQHGADPNEKDARGKTVIEWTTNQRVLALLIRD